MVLVPSDHVEVAAVEVHLAMAHTRCGGWVCGHDPVEFGCGVRAVEMLGGVIPFDVSWFLPAMIRLR